MLSSDLALCTCILWFRVNQTDCFWDELGWWWLKELVRFPCMVANMSFLFVDWGGSNGGSDDNQSHGWASSWQCDIWWDCHNCSCHETSLPCPWALRYVTLYIYVCFHFVMNKYEIHKQICIYELLKLYLEQPPIFKLTMCCDALQACKSAICETFWNLGKYSAMTIGTRLIIYTKTQKLK